MPAVSQAQREYLNARFGHAWVKRHHFDNKGPLPARADQKGHTMGKSMALGGGGRFAALVASGKSPALAAYIGRKKYGKKKFAQLSAHGKHKHHRLAKAAAKK